MGAENIVYILSLKDMFTSVLQGAHKETNEFEASMKDLQQSIGAAFAVDKVIEFGRSIVDAGSKVENATTGLTTLLRDANEAQKVIQNTMADATTTPFAFESLLQANKALISAGDSAEQARADVLNLANAIAATGGGDDELQRMVVNLQQIKNVGQATALDIKQFAYAGVNVYKVLADATGKPIEAVKDMTVTYDLLSLALEKAHQKGGVYADGLENMANNTSVRLSNIGDSLFQLKVRMFDDLKPAIDFGISAIQHFVQALSNLWNWIKDNKETIIPLATAIGVVAGAIGVVTVATNLWTMAQLALNSALLANPVTWVVAGITLIIAGFVKLWRTVEGFRAGLYALWEWLKVFGTSMWKLFDGIGNVIMGALTLDWDRIKSGWNETATSFTDFGKKSREAWDKGWKEGAASFAADHASTTAHPEIETKAKTVAPSHAADGKANKETTKAQGTKSVTINIKIENLVHDFTVKTTNITEGVGKVREMVTQALVSSLNDAQLIGGQ